mmetsp:Transcript_12490/g.44167  ORF Transcript_12490/g.44167 Transcript_12490/m.44167 type:complete len:128 (-) Transcript_12490:223-606(-)
MCFGEMASAGDMPAPRPAQSLWTQPPGCAIGGSLVEIGRHRPSSLVLESALEVAAADIAGGLEGEREAIVRALLHCRRAGASPLEELTFDKFGNYLVAGTSSRRCCASSAPARRGLGFERLELNFRE